MAGLSISEHDPASSTAGELDELVVLLRTLDAERAPADPPLPDAVYRHRYTMVTSDARRRSWLARDERGRLIGVARLELPLVENLGTAFPFVAVHPEARRAGVGRALLARVVANAASEGRVRLVAGYAADDRVPAGRVFAEACGFEVVIALHTNELDLSAVDRDGLARLRAGAAAVAVGAGYTLDVVAAGWPDALLRDLGTAYELMRDAPVDRATLDDERWPADRVRERGAAMDRQGRACRTLLARARNGEVAGFTELSFLPAVPAVVQQHGTAVARAHRGHRLGLWLKAVNLERLLAELPGARVVRTGNADSNAPMLRVNAQLGFRPAFAAYVLEAPRDRVAARLGA